MAVVRGERQLIIRGERRPIGRRRYPTRQTERKAARQESLIQRLGGGLARGVEWAWGTEENPSWLQAAVELLSTPSYVGTSALDYARRDKSAFQGALEGAQLGVSPLLKKLGIRPKPARAKKQMWSDVGAEEVSKMFPTVPEYSSGAGLATLANFIPRAVGGLAGLGIDLASDPLTWLSAGGEGVVKMATRALAKEGLAALSLETKKGVSSAARILTEDRLKMLKGFKKIEDVDIPAERAKLTKQFESAIEKAYKTEGPLNLRTRTVFGEPNLEYGAAEIAGKGYKRLPFTPTYEQAGKSFPSKLGRAMGIPRGVTAVKQVLAPYLQGLSNTLHYQIPLPTQGPLGAVTKLFFKPVERDVPWLREQAPGEIGAAGMPSSGIQLTRQTPKPKPPPPPAGGATVPTPPVGPTAPSGGATGAVTFPPKTATRPMGWEPKTIEEAQTFLENSGLYKSSRSIDRDMRKLGWDKLPSSTTPAGRTTEDLFNQAMDALEVEKRAPAAAEAPKVQMLDVEIGKPAPLDPEVFLAVETNPVIARIVEEATSIGDVKAVISVEGKQLGPEVSETLEAIAKTRESFQEAKLHLEQIQAEQAKTAIHPEVTKLPNLSPETQALVSKRMAEAATPEEAAKQLEVATAENLQRNKMVPLAFEPKSLKMSIGPTKQTVTFTDLAGNQQTVEATVRRVNVGQSIRKVMGEDTSLKTWKLIKAAGGGGLEEGRFIEVVLPPMSENVTFYERTGLTKMIDTLIAPISRIHKIDPILNERGRQFDAKMLVHKQEIDQIAIGFVKKFSELKDIKQFHKYMEDPAFAKTLSPQQAQEFADARKIWDDWIGTETSILPTMLKAEGIQQNFLKEYISHIRTEKFDMDWDEIASKTSSALSSWEKFKLHRVNSTLDELIKKEGGGAYEENAAVILGIRLYSGWRALEKKAYLDQLLNKKSQDLGLVWKGTNPPAGYITIEKQVGSEMFPQLKGWSIREDVYLHLNHQFEEWKTNLVYWNILAKIQRFWKPIATIYNPKFHARNLEGNIWNIFLKGVINPNRIFQAAAVQSETINKRLGGIKIKLDGGYEVGADELRKLFLKEGLLNRGAFSADIDEIISKTLQREIKGAGSLKGKLIDMPRKVGQAIEDNARIALAIDRLEKGDDVAGMMAAVREALFDYDEITPWEKGIRRNVLPFYVWYRKNIPLQIRYFFKQPGKFSAAVKTASAIEGEGGRKEREEIQPDWMKKAHGFNLTPLLGKTKTGEQRLAGAALPYEDPFRFAENPGRELAGQLNPGIRLPVEMFFREDLGTGQKWDKPGLEGTGLSGRKVENLIGSLPKPLWPVFGIRQFSDPETGVKVTEMKPEFYNLWRTMFRPGREIAAMADTEKDALTRVLSQVLTMIEVDPERAKFFKAWRRTKRNEAILKEAQRDVPFRRRKYR